VGESVSITQLITTFPALKISALHPLATNALSAIKVAEAGTFIVFNAPVPANACVPIEVNPCPANVTLARLTQPTKAWEPIVLTDSGITIVVIVVLSNALSPIEVTRASPANVTPVRRVQRAYFSFGIAVTSAGIVSIPESGISEQSWSCAHAGLKRATTVKQTALQCQAGRISASAPDHAPPANGSHA
jgi:hypothetical protein